MRGLGLAILCLLAFSACSSPSESEEKFHEIKIDDLPKEARIPSSLWERLEGKNPSAASGPHEEAKEEGHGGGAEPESAAESGVLFMPVNVILKEKNEGVLTEPAIRISFPRGGGTVDFAKFLTGRPGSFYVRFEWPEAEDKPETVKAWYDSKARRRKLDDGHWGAGCGKYFEITEGLKAAMLENGLKVNTTRERHASVLGGHFLFSLEKNKQVFVTKVTFTDSRRPVLFCEEL